MKSDEPFDPTTKSCVSDPNLIFRFAKTSDRETVTNLMAERNPDKNRSDLLRTTDKEIELNSSDPNYRLFVAELNGEVVGLCRYYDSAGLPKEKLLFPAPHGWYCMGLIVDTKMRRKGIARFLFKELFKSLKERGVSTVYSFVDSDNLSSVKMHHEVGFIEISRGPGFLHIGFDDVGILYSIAI
jgi:ribosomal protein S18 acetylase RimI-like enzyme